MATVSIDLHFAKLVKAYLDHADSISAGVPATTVLPRVIGKSAGNTKSDPQATIHGVFNGAGKGGVVEILIEIKSAVKEGLTAEMVSAWQKAIGDRLTNSTDWYLWLAAQPEADRTGFKIMKWGTPTVSTISLDGSERELTFPITQRVSIARWRVI